MLVDETAIDETASAIAPAMINAERVMLGLPVNDPLGSFSKLQWLLFQA
jgi:hypothetical protein